MGRELSGASGGFAPGRSRRPTPNFQTQPITTSRLPMRLPILICLFCLFSAAVAFSAPAASKVWPMSDEGAAWMIERLPNAEEIGYPVGERTPTTKLPPAYVAVVEVPAYVELLSNTFAYSGAMAEPKAEAITRDGRPYTRYAFAPLEGDYGGWAGFSTHWVPRPTEADRQAPGVFAWHFETPEGAEAVQSLPIKLLPELPEFKGPQRLQVRLWQSSILNVRPDKLPEVLTLLQRSGFNTRSWW